MRNPVGEEAQPGREAFLLARFLTFFDLEIEVFDIDRLAVVVTPELVSPTSVLFDDLIEVVEELPVGIARALSTSARA